MIPPDLRPGELPDYWVRLREGDRHPIGIFPGDSKPDHWDSDLLVPVWERVHYEAGGYEWWLRKRL